jgi:hypothetical protein
VIAIWQEELKPKRDKTSVVGFSNGSGKIYHANSQGTYIWLEKPPLSSGTLVELMLGSTTSVGHPEVVDFKEGVPFLVTGGLGDSSLGVSVQLKLRTLLEPDDDGVSYVWRSEGLRHPVHSVDSPIRGLSVVAFSQGRQTLNTCTLVYAERMVRKTVSRRRMP